MTFTSGQEKKFRNEWVLLCKRVRTGAKRRNIDLSKMVLVPSEREGKGIRWKE